MCGKVFGFVKRNLSGAKRRMEAASGERGAGKGAAALVPASARSDPERDKRSDWGALLIAGVRRDHSPFLIDIDLWIFKADDREPVREWPPGMVVL